MWKMFNNQKSNNNSDKPSADKPYSEEVGELDLGQDTVYEPYVEKQKTWEEEIADQDYSDSFYDEEEEIDKISEETSQDTISLPYASEELSKKDKKLLMKKKAKEEKKKQSKAKITFQSFFTAKEDKKTRTNLHMVITVIPIIVVFVLLISYLVSFMLYDSQAVISSPYNKRTSKIQEKVKRGKIFSANDKILAETIRVDGTDQRSYPYANIFAQVVGYSRHGKGGLESEYNYNLLVSHTDVISQIKHSLISEKVEGDSLYTTLDTRLQNAAYEALGDYRGAVIAIEPKTGKVRAMVSKPDFDPNYLDENWGEISQDSESGRLMNRCIQGLYPPGSTYKILTSLEYIDEHPNDYGNYSYNCEGSTIVNSVKIKCYHDQAHGQEDLEKAFAKSCNTAFVSLGCSLNLKKFLSLNEKCLFNKEIDFTLPIKKSRFKLTMDSPKSALPQTVIGQGDTLVTPMHMAMIMCAVANDGVLMKPTLFDRIESVEGKVIKENRTEAYKTLMTSGQADALEELLHKVVTEGTASAVNSGDYTAAAKTGTAENEKEKPHSWFVGYSNIDDPDLVVCVLVENSGAGSEYATPIAREVFDCYYGNEMNYTYSIDKED